jgi:hypothetical protein
MLVLLPIGDTAALLVGIAPRLARRGCERIETVGAIDVVAAMPSVTVSAGMAHVLLFESDIRVVRVTKLLVELRWVTVTAFPAALVLGLEGDAVALGVGVAARLAASDAERADADVARIDLPSSAVARVAVGAGVSLVRAGRR